MRRARLQTIEIRHTDRRPLLDNPVPADAIEAMRTVASASDIGWHTLDRDAVLELAAVTSRAQRDQVADAATQAECDESDLRRWTRYSTQPRRQASHLDHDEPRCVHRQFYAVG